ncbi:serine/threonine-protein kinase/endoribonuclease ire-1-like [Daphnia pulicaria]|uniref:serine/threonine-protein kinase/endoribonuclease ire-1-like n=1 Tax=Daphnia pulicaria TaxID=35523 RepID=UPI001EE9EE3D|nr:serine/threonine-protein kinase/endoribonuclease ire-1-like [Daphnia pulicaria]
MDNERWSTSRSIKWDENDILGRGCEGTVVFSGHFDGKEVAVKRLLLTNLQLVERELEALLHFSHPRILQLYHVEKESPFLRLALELCVATLDDYCKEKYTGPMPEEMDALKQMLEGLAFIHSRKYVHRDVKPNNILISQSGELKIADFGFCKPVRGIDSFSMSNAGVGTGGWMAPELLKSIADQESGGSPASYATTAVDVFPLGCVFYYFITKGVHPFGNTTLRNGNILMGKHNLSKLGKRHILRALIKEMISPNPEQRPKLDEVLTRPMFNTTESEELLKNDTKFALWLKNIKSQFASTKKRRKQPFESDMTNDECDSIVRAVPFQATNARIPVFQGITNLQVVNEESSPAPLEGLKMSTRRRAQTDSNSVTHRLQVSSAPANWQRTVPRSRRNWSEWSEFLSSGENVSEPSCNTRLRSVASLSNLDPGIASSADSLSNLSITSSTPSKTSSLLSLSRSIIGDIFNKST